MPKLKKYYVMRPTPSGYHSVCETRFGRFFQSIDKAVDLAKKVGGSVYERGGRLVFDVLMEK